MGLARGILVAAVVFTSGRMADPAPSPLDRPLKFIRSQDFAPLLDVARKRLEGHFSPEREARFFESVFSLSGKWKAMTRGREAYERFVGRTFERTVVEPGELAAVTEAIRRDWAFGMAASENRLLALVYSDLRPFRPELTMERLHLEYHDLAASLAPRVLKDLGMNAVSIAASEAAVMLLAAAMTSAGLSGGAAATGAAGGPWTLGVSLVVGLVVGIAIDQTAGEAYEEGARTQIHLQVNGIRNRMIDDVFEALARAAITYRELQERCVRVLYEGGPHERSVAGR
jgi:hypothetical protein